jgi:hypothetical protein
MRTQNFHKLRAMILPGLVVYGLMAAVAAAQEKPKPADQPDRPGADAMATLSSGGTPAAATVEKIMEQAVKNIARRYNLNEAQTIETDKLMKREVQKFLKEHEAEVWPVIRDLIAAQFGGKPPEADEAKRIGAAAKPLAGLAKEAIYRANDEWRMFLNTEQKAVHDYDLAEMEKQFQKIDRNFTDWSAGTPTDAGLFPPPASADLSPPRPTKPSPGLPDPEVEIFRISIFATFVEEFIKENQLNQGQIDSARSILKEYEGKANDFKKNKKEELAKVAAAQRAALEARDREKMAAADNERKKLLEPVQALIGEMEERLKGLLTSAQLERYASRRVASPKPSVAPVESPPKAVAPSPPPADVPKPEPAPTQSKPAQP